MPETKNQVNLVSKIPDDKQKTIGTEIVSDVNLDLDSRQEWETNREKWYKLWACKRDPKTTPWPGASNICVPLIAVAANQFHARAYQSIFAPNEFVKTLPVGQNDFKRAKSVAHYMNWQLMHEMEEYEDVFDKTLLQLPINGIAFKKISWNKKLARPVTDYISPVDLVLPYRTKSIETARRITHQIYLHYSELEERNAQGLYENFGDLAETGTVDDRESAIKETADKITGKTETTPEDIPHTILECHKNYDLGNGKGMHPYIFTVDKATGTLLRVTSREFKRDSETITLNYFIDYHFLPNIEGFYSFGLGHFLEQLNEMANTAFNQIFDAGRLTNQPFGFYGRRAGIKAKKIQLAPGVMNPIEDPTQILFPQMQRVDSVLFGVLGLIDQYAERLTSVTDNLLGREQKGVERPTKGGTEAKIEQGLTVFNILFKRIYRSLKKELRLIKTFNEIYLGETKQYRVLEGPDNIAFSELKRDDFGGVQDVIPVGDPSYASRAQRRQEAFGLYEVSLNNPLVGGIKDDENFPPNKRAIHAVLSNLYDTFPDMKRRSQILPEIPDPPVSPDIENSMFMQGDTVSPQLGEDHALHLATHVNFMASEFYLSMPKEYKNLHAQHILQTQQLQQMEQAQQQQLGEDVNV